jgi:hypothetical protein
MSVVSTPGTFSEKKAAYAAWRERLRSGVQANKVIDLTEEQPAEFTPWSSDTVFSSSEEADDLLDELAE